MDLQSVKINFIKDFLKLNNEQAIVKLSKVLNQEKKRLYNQELKPMKMEAFNKMIDNAEEDSKQGRIKDARKLRKEIDSWK